MSRSADGCGPRPGRTPTRITIGGAAAGETGARSQSLSARAKTRASFVSIRMESRGGKNGTMLTPGTIERGTNIVHGKTCLSRAPSSVRRQNAPEDSSRSSLLPGARSETGPQKEAVPSFGHADHRGDRPGHGPGGDAFRRDACIERERFHRPRESITAGDCRSL